MSLVNNSVGQYSNMSKEELIKLLQDHDKSSHATSLNDKSTNDAIEKVQDELSKEAERKSNEKKDEIVNQIKENDPTTAFSTSAQDMKIATSARPSYLPKDPSDSKVVVPSINGVPPSETTTQQVRETLQNLQSIGESTFAPDAGLVMNSALKNFAAMFSKPKRTVTQDPLVRYTDVIPHFLRLVFTSPSSQSRTDGGEVTIMYPMPVLGDLSKQVTETIMTGHIVIDCNIPGCELKVDSRSPVLMEAPGFVPSTAKTLIAGYNTSDMAMIDGAAELIAAMLKLFSLSASIGNSYLMGTTYDKDKLDKLEGVASYVAEDSIPIQNKTSLSNTPVSIYTGRYLYWPTQEQYTGALPNDDFSKYPHYLPELLREYKFEWAKRYWQTLYDRTNYEYGADRTTAVLDANVKMSEKMRCCTDLAMTKFMTNYRRHLTQLRGDVTELADLAYSIILQDKDFLAGAAGYQYTFFMVKTVNVLDVAAKYVPNYINFINMHKFSFKLADGTLTNITSRITSANNRAIAMFARFPNDAMEMIQASFNADNNNATGSSPINIQKSLAQCAIPPDDTAARMLALSLEGINAMARTTTLITVLSSLNPFDFLNQLIGIVVMKNMYINFFMFNQAAYYSTCHEFLKKFFETDYNSWFRTYGLGRANGTVIRTMPTTRSDFGVITWSLENKTTTKKATLFDQVRDILKLSNNISYPYTIEDNRYRVSGRIVRVPGRLVLGNFSDYTGLDMYNELVKLPPIYVAYANSSNITSVQKRDMVFHAISQNVYMTRATHFSMWFHSVYCPIYLSIAKSPMYWRSDYEESYSTVAPTSSSSSSISTPPAVVPVANVSDKYYFSEAIVIDEGDHTKYYNSAVVSVPEDLTRTWLPKESTGRMYTCTCPNAALSSSAKLDIKDMNVYSSLLTIDAPLIDLYEYLDEVQLRHKFAMPVQIVPYFMSGDPYQAYPNLKTIFDATRLMTPSVNAYATWLRLLGNDNAPSYALQAINDPQKAYLLPDIRLKKPTIALACKGEVSARTVVTTVDMIPKYQKDTFKILMDYMFHEDFGMKRLHVGRLIGKRTIIGDITPLTPLHNPLYRVTISTTVVTAYEVVTGNQARVYSITVNTNDGDFTIEAANYNEFISQFSQIVSLPIGLPSFIYEVDPRVPITHLQKSFIDAAVKDMRMVVSVPNGSYYITYHYTSDSNVPCDEIGTYFDAIPNTTSMNRYDNTLRTNGEQSPFNEMANALNERVDDPTTVIRGLHFSGQRPHTQVMVGLMLQGLDCDSECKQTIAGTEVNYTDNPYVLNSVLPVEYFPLLRTYPVVYFAGSRR